MSHTAKRDFVVPPTPKTFGGRLKLARETLGMTQDQVAAAIGSRRGGTVGDWENDKGLPEGDYMVQLPDVLQVSADWLLLGKIVPGGMPTLRREALEALRAWLDEVLPPE